MLRQAEQTKNVFEKRLKQDIWDRIVDWVFIPVAAALALLIYACVVVTCRVWWIIASLRKKFTSK
jgi:hypothetical protein